MCFSTASEVTTLRTDRNVCTLSLLASYNLSLTESGIKSAKVDLADGAKFIKITVFKIIHASHSHIYMLLSSRSITQYWSHRSDAQSLEK